MLKQVFGPVPSRRLGKSLGIDPVPLKACNWNCVYCQLGRTRPFTTRRKVFFPPENIISQVKKALTIHKPGEIDWITFVGSGETMLNSSVGWLICELKMLTRIPVAVITNGSLLYLPEIRQELKVADAVLPSLDAGNSDLYKKINRPHPEFTFEKLVEGEIAFRKEYEGKLWVEVMLIRDINDTAEALTEISSILKDIQPDEIHIVQPDRPPTESWVQPTNQEGLMRAKSILGQSAKVIPPATGDFDLSGYGNLVDAIVGIITRHPIKETDLIETLAKWPSQDVSKTLSDLESSGKAQVVIRYGTRFWSATQAKY